MKLRLLALVAAIGCLVVPVQAAMTVTELLAEANSTDGTSIASTGTFSVGNNALGLCGVLSTAASAPALVPTLTGGSATWTQAATVTLNTSWTLTLFRALGTGAAAAVVTADYAGSTATAAVFNCMQVTNPDLSGTNGSGAIAQTQTQAPGSTTACGQAFSNALGGATQTVLQFGVISATRTWTPDSAPNVFSVGTEVGVTSPAAETKVQYFYGGTENNPQWTVNTATQLGCIAVEVKEAAAVGGTATWRGLLLGVS